MWPVAELSKDHIIGSVAVRYDRIYVHKKALLIVICRNHHMLSQVLGLGPGSVTILVHLPIPQQENKSKSRNTCTLPWMITDVFANVAAYYSRRWSGQDAYAIADSLQSVTFHSDDPWPLGPILKLGIHNAS